MADVSYATLHKRTSEGGWLATLSTPPPPPPGSAPAHPQALRSFQHTMCERAAFENLENGVCMGRVLEVMNTTVSHYFPLQPHTQ